MTIASKCKKKRRVFPQKRKLRTSSEPLKLKDTVTKWSGFYSQVSELNLKGAATQNPDLEIHESEFFRRLREAQEENFSGSFQEFTKDVFTFRNHSGKKKKGMRNLTECSNSLAIFLYNRESIYQTLIQCLEKQETSDLGSLYNISVGFFADVSLTKEIEVYFDGFMKVFESSLSQRTDASVVQIIFQSLLSIVKELLKNSSLTTMQLSDKLIYLFDSNKYPDYVIDFISVVFAPILRKNKFNRDEVLHSILKTECVDGIVKVLGRAIKNFGSNFFTGAEKAWSNYLESINDSVILEELHDFIINSDPSVIEFEPLVKLTITAFMSDPCKFSRSLNKLIMRKKAKFIPGGYISKILRNGLPDELFNEGYEIGSLIITSLVALPEHKIQRFDLKNFVRDILKKRPQIISHLSVDDEKFNYLLMPLFIEACGCTQMDEDIMPYVEPLGNLIAGTYSDQDSNLPQYKIVEFSTDQPNSLNTFPNRIIRLIDDLKTRESALKALLGVRPLNKKIIIKKLRLLVELDFKDDEMSYFVLHILHDLMSKSEFLKLSKDLKLVDKLLKLVQSSKAAIYPFQNLNLICTSNIENFLSAKEIFDVLVPHLSSGQPKIRHCVLNSLAALKSNEEENTIMKHALEAERIKIDLSNYKERIRLLSYLEKRPDDEGNTLRSSSVLEEVRIRVLCSNLMLNFSLLWEPIAQLILSFPKNSSDQSLFWKIYFEILSSAYQNITSDDCGDNVDYVNFRNLLLKMCESLPGTQLQKWNRNFVSNFLDIFLINEFNRKRKDDVNEELEEKNMDGNEENGNLDVINCIENGQDIEVMAIDSVKVNESENMEEFSLEKTETKYFKAIKNVSKSLNHHLKIFSKMSNLRSVYRYVDLRAFIVQNLLSDPFLENRKMALDFILVSENKCINQNQRDVLNALTDKKGWKTSLRDFVQKFNEENEVYSSVSWITNKFISGLLKETRYLKHTSQVSNRKTILEIISKFKDFDNIFNDILDDIDTTHYWELNFDILLIGRQYLSISDNLAKRAISTVEVNLPYINKDSKKSKDRYKAIEVYTKLIKTLRNQYLWPFETKKKFMKTCILPLFIDIYERRVLSKNALILFKALVENSLEWVIIKTSEDSSLLDYILKDFDDKKKYDGSDFYRLNLNVLCHVLRRLVVQEEEGFGESVKILASNNSPLLNARLALPIISSINLKANIEDINLRLDALRALTIIFPNYQLNKEELDKFCDNVASRVRFSSIELQSECIKIILMTLKKLDNSKRDQLSTSVFKLISKIQDPNQKSRYIETVYSLLSDKKEFKGYDIAYDICQNYEKIISGASSSLKIFIFYNALAEVKRSEFANRRMGSNCIIGLLQHKEVDLITEHVLPEIVSVLNNRKSTSETTTEMITLLQFLIKHYSDSFEDLKILSNLTNIHDPDEDFYSNMKHLQSIRRSRALKKMANKIVELEEDLSQDDGYTRVIFEYIYPLCASVLFNEKTTKYSELIESAMDLIGALAKRCDFNRYKKILMHYLSMDKSIEGTNSSAFRKQRIKLIARVIDSFHFESQSLDFLLSKIFVIIDSTNHQGYENSSHEVLYLPIIKLLQVSKSKSTDEYISRIIVKLAKGLRMREFTTRDRIRSTLNSIAHLLGHNYLAYIISILESSLKRGYELHVLIYSIKSMIIFCSENFKSGNLDSLLPTILKLTRLELFESVKEEKSISKICTKTPEAKKISSYSLVEVMSKFASRSISMNIIKPFAGFLYEFKSFEALENLRKLFKHISDGFCVNESIQTLDLLAIVHAVLNEKVFNSSEKEVNLTSRQTTVLVEFALLILSRILNGVSNLDSSDFVTFVPLILDKCNKIRDTEVISLTVSIFTRLVHMSESFRDLVPMNDVFRIIVRSLIVEGIYSKEPEKIKFQDLSSSFLNVFLEKGGKLKDEDLDSIKLFLQFILDSKSIGSRTTKLLGAVIKRDSVSTLNESIMKRLTKDFIETTDGNLTKTLAAAIMNYLKSGKSCDWTIKFLLQQFHYGGENGRLRAIKMAADILGDDKFKYNNISLVSVFVMTAKILADEKSKSCVDALRSVFNSLRCSDSDINTISQLVQSWISGSNSDHLIVSAKTILQISKTENKRLINIVRDVSEDLKNFIEDDNTKLDSLTRTLYEHVKVDYLTSVYRTCKKKSPEFFTWLLPLVDKYIMNSKSILRRSAIVMLSSVMSEVPSVMDTSTIESHKGIFRQILLNLMEVLKLNLSICDEDLFEKVSVALIYFSKTTDPMLLIGKLIGVARYEVENLSFSYKRREILFTVVGVLCTKYPLSKNMLRSVLKMARALIEHEETSEMVEEFYNKLEASTDDPDALTMISNAKNRVDIMEGKLKRKGTEDAKIMEKRAKKAKN